MKSKRAVAPLALTVLAGALFLIGCRDAKTYMDRGDAYFSQGKFSEATLNYRKALQKDPSLGEAYLKSGLAELKENKAAEALSDLQKAAQMMPDNPRAKNELTNLLLGIYIGDTRHPKFVYDLMVRYSDEWLKRDPQSKQGLRIKGYVAMLERRPEDAVVLFRRALQGNPEDEQMALSLMDALFRNGQPADAEKAGLDFITRHPNAADVYDALFRLYNSSNRAPDAVQILERKVNGNPKQGDYILQLAQYYALTHNQAGVEQAMRMFLANPGGDPLMHLKAGDAYAAMGNFTTALEQYYAGLSEAAQKKNQSDCVKYQKRVARAQLSLGHKTEAMRALDTALSHDSGDQEAQALRAGLLVANGKSGGSGEGVKQFEGLVEKNPDDVVLRFALAKALLETGDLGAARSQLQQVIGKNPAFLEAHIQLADVAFRQGNYTEAASSAQAALEIDPANARAQLLEGRALMRTGSLDQAANVLGKLSRENPQSLDVAIELARIQALKNRYMEAEDAFNKILASHPGELRALAGLVDVDVARKRPDQALARLDRELMRSQNSPPALYLAAITAVRLGKLDASIVYLQRLTEKTPDSVEPQLELAGVFQLKGDYRRAMDTLRTTAALHPKDPRPNAMLSSIMETNHDQHQATALAKKALSQQPSDPAAMNNLAYLLAETGDDLDQALKLAKQAVQANSKEPLFEDTLGFVYLRKGQNDEAMQIFDRLARSFPREPIYSYHLGMTYFQMGDRSRAKATLLRTLQMRPSRDIANDVASLVERLN